MSEHLQVYRFALKLTPKSPVQMLQKVSRIKTVTSQHLIFEDKSHQNPSKLSDNLKMGLRLVLVELRGMTFLSTVIFLCCNFHVYMIKPITVLYRNLPRL